MYQPYKTARARISVSAPVRRSTVLEQVMRELRECDDYTRSKNSSSGETARFMGASEATRVTSSSA
jgi:hypothetical protein